MSTDPEQLKPVRVDPIAGEAGYFGHYLGDAAIRGVGRPAAIRADDMVVMGRTDTRHVCMSSCREINPLDNAQFRQQVERPEDSPATDAETTIASVRFKFGRREGPVIFRDQVRDGSPGRSQAIAGHIESRDYGVRIRHCR
jgi:hypothetical protein